MFIAVHRLSLVAARRAILHWDARISHCGGFSCCGALAPEHTGCNSCGTACGPGIKSMSPALADGFSSAVPPGKSLKYSWLLQCCVNFCCRAKWLSYLYMLFHILFHYGLLQYIDYSSLGCTVGRGDLSLCFWEGEQGRTKEWGLGCSSLCRYPEGTPLVRAREGPHVLTWPWAVEVAHKGVRKAQSQLQWRPSRQGWKVRPALFQARQGSELWVQQPQKLPVRQDSLPYQPGTICWTIGEGSNQHMGTFLLLTETRGFQEWALRVGRCWPGALIPPAPPRQDLPLPMHFSPMFSSDEAMVAWGTRHWLHQIVSRATGPPAPAVLPGMYFWNKSQGVGMQQTLSIWC